MFQLLKAYFNDIAPLFLAILVSLPLAF